MRFALDDVGLVLSLLETIILLLGLVFYVWATITISTDTLLHANFRINLCIILFRSVLIPLKRLPTLYWRAFIVGEDGVPFIAIYNELTMFTSNLLCTCLLVLSVERMLHTHVKRFSESGLIGRLAVLGMLIMSNGCLFILRRFWFNAAFSIAFLIAVPVISFILLVCVFRTNLRRRKAHCNLEDKAEAIWNMNSVRIFLPAMFASSALTLAYGLLGLAQLFWMPQERVGRAESKLNNVYGLIASADALLTPLLVVMRHRQLKRIAAVRISKELGQQAMSSEQHLKQFQFEWRVAH